MNSMQFLEQIRRRTGLGARDARVATSTTLEILGQHLPDPDRDAVCRKLPADIAQFLRRSHYDGDIDADELFELVSELEGVTLGFAAEHAKVVCQVLAEAVGDEGQRHLAIHASPSLAALFEPRAAPPSAPSHEHPHLVAPGQGHTLASGRPGSYRPISEAHGTAQHDSVVESDNPHGDVKLSSTRGLSQERFDETLAKGKPGSKRPLSDAKG